MAKLRDEMIRAAEYREQGARDMRLRQIKGVSITLGPMKEVRNESGRVYKMVSTLTCRMQVAGHEAPVERFIEKEATEQAGIFGELELALSPALKKFLDGVDFEMSKEFRDKDKPLDPEAFKSMLDKGRTTLQKEKGKVYPAKKEIEHIKAAESGPPEEPEREPAAAAIAANLSIPAEGGDK